MHTKPPKKQLLKFLESEKALAIPVTYLVLFVLLITLISATYSYAVVRIGAKGAVLKASVAKQNIQFLDDAVQSVAWSFGASRVVRMDNCGGTFRMATSAKNLVINFTDDETLNDIVFNSSVGKASYELDTPESSYDNLFIRGDDRAIVNQSSFTTTQLYASARELILCYRPSTTVAAIGNSSGKPSNLIRIYIINLNSSQVLTLTEEFRLKVTSVDVTTAAHQYEFNSSISSVALKAVLDGTWAPSGSQSQAIRTVLL